MAAEEHTCEEEIKTGQEKPSKDKTHASSNDQEDLDTVIQKAEEE